MVGWRPGIDIHARGPALRRAIAAATVDRVTDPRGFDAIVVGAGAAGGMAATLLTQAGLAVLVLDAGWPSGFLRSPLRRTAACVVRTVANPRLMTVLPPPVVRFGRRALRAAGRLHQPVQTRCFAWELAPESFVDDRDNPYVDEPGSRVDWFRAHQIGGRMVIPGHGRQYYRLGAQDLTPDDGLGPAWPLAPGELDSWYDRVERALALTGGADHTDWVPDATLSHLRAPSAAEVEVIAAITHRWHGAQPVLGRFAPPLPGALAAAATGRLLCRQGAIVRDVEVDTAGRATAVRWHDRATRQQLSARAPLIFLCASSLETTRILLASGDGRIGRRSGALGRYLMDHVMISGEGGGGMLPDAPVTAGHGHCVYLPRFDLRDGRRNTGRGYGMQIYRWSTTRGRSHFQAVSFAEMLPRAENRIVLDPNRRDAWGHPVPRIACRHSAEERRAAADQTAAIRDVAALFGVRLHRLDEAPASPGTAMHECGTARMGDSPADSVLDPNNQCWDAKGVYVTDGACFPSQGAQNPTLTILALTARACAHAVSEHR